jgi:purine-nucleoside phosphorylase
VAATLVVSAWEPEVAPLRRLAASAGERALAMVAVGVGSVDAAVGAARAIAAHRPRRVIFVGTAGLYPGTRVDVDLGEAVVAGELIAISTAALRGDGYLPAPQVMRVGTTPRLRAALLSVADAEGEAVPVACPTAITGSVTLARRITRSIEAVLENLEVFGVARAAGAAGVEMAAVLGIANRVGPGAHREWRAHHAAASRAACSVVAAALEAGALTPPSRAPTAPSRAPTAPSRAPTAPSRSTRPRR